MPVIAMSPDYLGGDPRIYSGAATIDPQDFFGPFVGVFQPASPITRTAVPGQLGLK